MLRPRRPAAPLALLLALALAPRIAADGIDERLDTKAAYARQIKSRVEELHALNSGGAEAQCPLEKHAYSTCSSQLPDPQCDGQFGDSAGCDCVGTRVSVGEPVIKRLEPTKGRGDSQAAEAEREAASEAAARRLACYTTGLNGTLRGMHDKVLETGDAKWLYYADAAGALLNYPGFLWPRNPADVSDCDRDYDPRLRPWMMSGATGPKNVVFILDVSGSMSKNDRIGLLRQAASEAVDTLTHADFVGVVTFNSEAQTFLGLTTLARAKRGFRELLKDSFKTDLNPAGGTNFIAGFSEAFSLVDASRSKNYGARCHTAYIFLTDGEADSPKALIERRRAAVADEHFFLVALGSGAATEALEEAACASDGMFVTVADGDERALRAAILSFFPYFAAHKAMQKSEGVVFSELYESIPNIWGQVTTAAAPVFDKTVEPWAMLGVAAADSATCDLVNMSTVTEQQYPVATEQGCTCLPEWTYEFEGRRKSYSSCTLDGWSAPWCATPAGCGVCETAAIGPNGCWDDCSPQGPEADVESRLLRRAEAYCSTEPLPPCALYALRAMAAGIDISAATLAGAVPDWGEASGWAAKGACGQPELQCAEAEDLLAWARAVRGFFPDRLQVDEWKGARWARYMEESYELRGGIYDNDMKACVEESVALRAERGIPPGAVVSGIATSDPALCESRMEPACACSAASAANEEARLNDPDAFKEDTGAGEAATVIGVVIAIVAVVVIAGGITACCCCHCRRKQQRERQLQQPTQAVQFGGPAQAHPPYPRAGAVQMGPISRPSAPPLAPPPSYAEAMAAKQAAMVH